MDAHLESLDQLKNMTASFLDLADWIGRPLLTSERRAFRFILASWEAPSIKAGLRSMPKKRLDFYTGLIAQLRELIVPDPAKQLRLQRVKPETVAEKHAGNNATKAPPFRGVSVRRLNAREATERVQLLSRLASDVAVIVRELALVRNRDRPEAARIVKLARLMAKLARGFAERGDSPIPEAPSIEEVMANMREMARLMEHPQ